MIIRLWEETPEATWDLVRDTGDQVGLEFGKGEAVVWPDELEPGAWVGIDFDGTWSSTDNPGHFEPPYPLGRAVPQMTYKVRIMMKAGIRVRLFTARAGSPEAVERLRDWMRREIGEVLEVTDKKDYNLLRFYDDRALQVIPNLGRVVVEG